MFKTLAIAATSIALTAGAASANNTFGILSGAELGDSYYDINVARTLGEGSVQIVSRAGDLLGMTDLNAGTNTDVRVFLDTPTTAHDIFARLLVDGEIVSEKRINVRR